MRYRYTVGSERVGKRNGFLAAAMRRRASASSALAAGDSPALNRAGSGTTKRTHCRRCVVPPPTESFAALAYCRCGADALKSVSTRSVSDERVPSLRSIERGKKAGIAAGVWLCANLFSGLGPRRLYPAVCGRHRGLSTRGGALPLAMTPASGYSSTVRWWIVAAECGRGRAGGGCGTSGDCGAACSGAAGAATPSCEARSEFTVTSVRTCRSAGRALAGLPRGESVLWIITEPVCGSVGRFAAARAGTYPFEAAPNSCVRHSASSTPAVSLCETLDDISCARRNVVRRYKPGVARRGDGMDATGPPRWCSPSTERRNAAAKSKSRHVADDCGRVDLTDMRIVDRYISYMQEAFPSIHSGTTQRDFLKGAGS
jgi:hypothetical protein